jgi:hypothetical protein
MSEPPKVAAEPSAAAASLHLPVLRLPSYVGYGRPPPTDSAEFRRFTE